MKYDQAIPWNHETCMKNNYNFLFAKMISVRSGALGQVGWTYDRNWSHLFSRCLKIVDCYRVKRRWFPKKSVPMIQAELHNIRTAHCSACQKACQFVDLSGWLLAWHLLNSCAKSILFSVCGRKTQLLYRLRRSSSIFCHAAQTINIFLDIDCFCIFVLTFFACKPSWKI